MELKQKIFQYDNSIEQNKFDGKFLILKKLFFLDSKKIDFFPSDVFRVE
jgi:hypothetical protein